MFDKYLRVLLIVAVAIGIRFLVGSQASSSAFVILLAGALLSAWIGGVGPCLLAQTILFVVHTRYFESNSEAYSWPPSARAIANTSAFYAVGLAVAVMSDRVRAGSQRLMAQAAEAVAEREQFRAVLSCIADGVLVTDASGRVTLMNPTAEQLLGLTLADARGKPLAEALLHFDLATRLAAAEAIKQVMQERRVIQSTTPLLLETADNYQLPLAFSVAPVCEGQQNLTGAVIVFRDDTDRRATEETLRSADRRKDEFLATLAHELRNPLAPICMGVELLKLPNQQPSETTEVLSMVERQARHMVRLIDDLLDVSRITRGKLELRKSRVALQAVLEHAIEASRPLIEQSSHELVLDLPAEPLYLDADRDRLMQVFSNLLNNAAKFTPHGGRITATAARHEGKVVLSIVDNGRGIAPAQLPTIFEMFNQARGACENGHSGLGIGLTLVKRLVEMHEGTIEAQSNGPGQGSCFTIRLPLAADQAPPSARPVAVPARIGPRPLRVLLVDDNRDVLSATTTLVRALGHEVRTAQDGVEAIEAAECFRPDVVLMDLGMPHMNGYDAARRIRSQAWGQQMSLVAVTGWGQLADQRRTDAAGFDGHLVKPLEPQSLSLALNIGRQQGANFGSPAPATPGPVANCVADEAEGMPRRFAIIGGGNDESRQS